jgi:hypothetical protein
MIFVTGATSKIGSSVLKLLEERRIKFLSYGRKVPKNDIEWNIGDEIRGDKEDILIFLAHDRSISSSKIEKKMQSTVDRFFGHIIYLSSFSATENSLSNYGQSKFLMERVVKEKNGHILRAGIFSDSHGIQIPKIQRAFLKYIEMTIQRNGFDCPFYVSSIEELSEIIVGSSENSQTGITNVISSGPFSLSDIRKMTTGRSPLLRFKIDSEIVTTILDGKMARLLKPKLFDPLLSVISEDYWIQFNPGDPQSK